MQKNKIYFILQLARVRHTFCAQKTTFNEEEKNII